MEVQTNWYVLTGGPSSGKTEVGLWLAHLGHQYIPEAARLLINDQKSRGATLSQIRADELAFQDQVLAMKIATEYRLDPSRVVFLDRGLPDTLAYDRILGQPSISPMDLYDRRYAGVFLMEQLPFVNDGVRTEDDNFAKDLAVHLRAVYVELGYEVIDVPVMPIAPRAEFILQRIKQ